MYSSTMPPICPPALHKIPLHTYKPSKAIFFLLLIISCIRLFSQDSGENHGLRPLSQFVGYYNVGTKANKPFFRSKWYLKNGELYTIYDSDIDRKFEPYLNGELNYNVFYNESDLPDIDKKDTTYYVVLKFKKDQLDQFKIIRPRSEWATDLYGYRDPELDEFAIDAEEQMTRELRTDNFRFVYSSPDDLFVKNFSKKIESRYDKLLADFGLPAMPVTTFKIYPDLETYHNGVLTPGAPEWQKARVWTENEIKLTSPTYLKNVLGEAIADDLLIHEYVHILHWNKVGDPYIIPKWLWEGVALYKGCCQWENIEQLEYLKKEKFPSLKEINRKSELQYQLGYHLIEFILVEWEWKKVIQLIENNGDIKESFNVTTKVFEKKFYNYLKKEYLKQ